MQHVTAFSRPQTVPPVPTIVPKRNVWILDSWRDLILYVGTPLLIIPLFTLAQARWNAQEIYLFVAAFGAMGHHLPGMIRAYGDRALFERFRWRFIIAPIFLLAVCVGFYFWDIKTNPVVMIVFLWGVWHGMMQTYGFGRIYDAKTGSFAALTRRIDFAGRDSRPPANFVLCRSGDIDSVAGELREDVGCRNPTESGEAGAFYYERCVLVVLQQRRGEHPRRYRLVRSLSRCAIPVPGLDLQPQPGGERQVHRRIHAIHFPSQRILDRALYRIGLCLRFHRLLEFEHRNRNNYKCAHRCGGGIRLAAFLLRRFHLESSREIDAPITGTDRRHGGCERGRFCAGLGVACKQVGGRVCHSARGDVVW